MKMELRSVGIHDGTFHADEVTACALLMLCDKVDQEKIVRTRDPKLLEKCEYVCDVGGLYDPSKKLFDHHQVDYQGPLSSAGMVLKYLHSQGDLSQEEFDYFHYSLVLGIDAHDNGKMPKLEGICSFSQVVTNFTPISYDATPEQQDKAFHEALTFVYGHLRRLRERYHYMRTCREAVDQAMQKDKTLLEFETPLSWLENFFDLGGEKHPAVFVIMPTGNQWKLRGIPPSLRERMQVRVPHPIEWAGLLEGEFEKVCGIKGAVFCHKERFISVWETEEAAKQALKKILKMKKEGA